MSLQSRLATTMPLLLSLIGLFTGAQANMDNDTQKALIIKDLRECGHGEYIMFTVLWKGVVGIATEPFLFGWSKPRIGDQLSGSFLESGTMEATYLDKGDTTRLDILKTGIPIENQGALVMEYCEGAR